MTLTTPLTDTLDSLRPEPLFEWTYAIIVVNLAVQFYRFIAQFAILFFDIFKLSYGVDLFWPLTTDDLKPFSHYFTTQNEILYKLVECLILTIAAFFATLCLLDNIIIGLLLSFFVFFIHGLLAIFGFICVGDHQVKIFSLEFILWFLSVGIEMAGVALTSAYIVYFGLLIL